VANCCERGNDPSDFITCWQIFLAAELLVGFQEGRSSLKVVRVIVTSVTEVMFVSPHFLYVTVASRHFCL
jgi:hypothetical protein